MELVDCWRAQTTPPPPALPPPPCCCWSDQEVQDGVACGRACMHGNSLCAELPPPLAPPAPPPVSSRFRFALDPPAA
eukprot:scaffold114878_cov9-Tisochrysis_lutea.AAC.1